MMIKNNDNKRQNCGDKLNIEEICKRFSVSTIISYYKIELH